MFAELGIALFGNCVGKREEGDPADVFELTSKGIKLTADAQERRINERSGQLSVCRERRPGGGRLLTDGLGCVVSAIAGGMEGCGRRGRNGLGEHDVPEKYRLGVRVAPSTNPADTDAMLDGIKNSFGRQGLYRAGVDHQGQLGFVID